MRAATVVQQLCKSCRTCFNFYCVFYFTCDHSLNSKNFWRSGAGSRHNEILTVILERQRGGSFVLGGITFLSCIIAERQTYIQKSVEPPAKRRMMLLDVLSTLTDGLLMWRSVKKAINKAFDKILNTPPTRCNRWVEWRRRCERTRRQSLLASCELFTPPMPTRLNWTVASRRRRRCVLGITRKSRMDC